MSRLPWLAGALMAIAAVSAGCRAEPNASEALIVTDIVTGWLDKGIVEGQNKLVPTISLSVKNGADQPLSYLELQAVFRIVDDPEVLGESLVVPKEHELAPGKSLGPFNFSSQLGYASLAPRTQMLQHTQFKDAKVKVLVKQGSRQWAPLGEYPIARQLLAAR